MNSISILPVVRSLADGVRTAKQIAEICGSSPKYVRKLMKKFDLPRRPQGGPTGVLNGSYCGGRTIDRDGYVLVSAPLGHPHARYVRNKNIGRILEHRLVMEKTLGRYLSPGEVVDHIDGNKMNNAPENLRLFASNADHLRKTITGKPHNLSDAGRMVLRSKRAGRRFLNQSCVSIYNQMKKSGEIRKRQILLAREQLGKDSPYVLGTERYLQPKQIHDPKEPDNK